MKYQGEEIGSNKCGITQICVAMAMLAGSFLTLIIIGLVINFLPAWYEIFIDYLNLGGLTIVNL